ITNSVNCQPNGLPRANSSRRHRYRMRNRKSECRARTGPAINSDIACHKLEVILNDAQAEAHAVEFSGMSLSDLLEGLENPVHLLRLDANTAVGDTKFDAALFGAVFNPQFDVTLRSKFKSVAD